MVRKTSFIISFKYNILIDIAEIIEPIGRKTEYIKEGNNVTFRCVGVGYPPPLVQWRKLNGSLSDRVSITNMPMSTNEGNVTNVTVDLIFTGAYREDTGVYECSASNLLNYVTRNVSLILQCMNVFKYVARRSYILHLIITLYVQCTIDKKYIHSYVACHPYHSKFLIDVCVAVIYYYVYFCSQSKY